MNILIPCAAWGTLCSLALGAPVPNGNEPPPNPHEWPIFGVDNPDPCQPEGVQVALVGPVVIWYRRGDIYVPAVSTPSNLPNLSRSTAKGGVAGSYLVQAQIEHDDVCANPDYNATTTVAEVSGGITWEGYFCEGPDCICAPTELRWKEAAIGNVTGYATFDFNDCAFWSSGSASAILSGSIVFSNGLEASFNLNPSGQEGISDLEVGFTPGAPGEAEIDFVTDLGGDQWEVQVTARVHDIGIYRRGCGFIGHTMEVNVNSSARASINKAKRSHAHVVSGVDPQSGIKTSLYAGQDGCMNPLDPGRNGEVRMLRDGTPITFFLEELARADLPQELKLEIIYDANCWGPEIDFYLNLLPETEVQHFFEIVDCSRVGIPSELE